MRRDDLQELEGHTAFIVFLWDGQAEPLFVPYAAYEEVFRQLVPAADGQYKAQVYLDADSLEFYIARGGRFNLEGMSGWDQLTQLAGNTGALTPEMTHSQVQSLLSAIGHAKGYDVWVPQNNRGSLERALIGDLLCREELPSCFDVVSEILQEVDVLWLRKGSTQLCGLFEVEHSTPIYSALLRFNDVHLTASTPNQTFRIIADASRRASFVRQVSRPTFRASGLQQICTFLEYRNVYGWFTRVCNRTIPHGAPENVFGN